jgi:sugar-specific transcriptional regulator TrmB
LSGLSWEKLCVDIGLSEYEARVYLALIRKGPMKASVASLASGVPRGKIYSILKKLIEMELAIEVKGNPKRFAPIPPATAFEEYFKEYERRTKNLLATITSLEQNFEETRSKAVYSRSTIWCIRGKDNILDKIKDLLSNAHDRVEILANDRWSIVLYKELSCLFDKLNEKKVKVVLFTPFRSFNKHILEQLQHILKTVDARIALPVLFVSVDEEYFLITIADYKRLSLDAEAKVALFSDNQILASLFKSLILKGRKQHVLPYIKQGKGEKP